MDFGTCLVMVEKIKFQCSGFGFMVSWTLDMSCAGRENVIVSYGTWFYSLIMDLRQICHRWENNKVDSSIWFYGLVGHRRKIRSGLVFIHCTLWSCYGFWTCLAVEEKILFCALVLVLWSGHGFWTCLVMEDKIIWSSMRHGLMVVIWISDTSSSGFCYERESMVYSGNLF